MSTAADATTRNRVVRSRRKLTAYRCTSFDMPQPIVTAPRLESACASSWTPVLDEDPAVFQSDSAKGTKVGVPLATVAPAFMSRGSPSLASRGVSRGGSVDSAGGLLVTPTEGRASLDCSGENMAVSHTGNAEYGKVRRVVELVSPRPVPRTVIRCKTSRFRFNHTDASPALPASSAASAVKRWRSNAGTIASIERAIPRPFCIILVRSIFCVTIKIRVSPFSTEQHTPTSHLVFDDAVLEVS